MAGKTENAFEVLSREEAAPEVENPASMVTKEDVKQGNAPKGALQQELKSPPGHATQPAQVDAPQTPGRQAAAANPQPPIKADVSKAPGDISYAQAAKEHTEAAKEKASESAQAGKEAAGEAKEAVKAKAGEAAEATKETAQHAKEATKETAERAKEGAKETAQAANQKAGELAESAKEAAAEARQKAGEIADVAREKAAQAGEAAREYAGAAQEKASEVAHVVGDSVSQAVGYIKEHLPEVHVERQDTTPEERESQALLDEAMALAGGPPAPIRPARAEPLTSRPAATTTSAPAGSSTGASDAHPAFTATKDEPLPEEPDYRAYPPRTATEVANRAVDRAEEVAEAARTKASELVHSAPGSITSREHEGTARDAARAGAPDELARRVEREEQSAKGPLQALADTVKSAADFVKEKVLHVPAATEETTKDARDATVGQMRAAGEEIEGTARVAADKASGAYEQAKGAVSSAADTASAKLEEAKEKAGELASRAGDAAQRAKEDVKGKAGEVADSARAAADRATAEHRDRDYGDATAAGEAPERITRLTQRSEAEARGKAVAGDVRGAAERAKDSAAATAEEAKERAGGALASARDKVVGAVETVEDKAKWAYEHTKEEVSKGAEAWNTPPRTPEEAAKNAGVIPSDTESLLKQRGGVASTMTEKGGHMTTPEILDDSALAYGEENLAGGGVTDWDEDAARIAGKGPQAPSTGAPDTKGALERVSEGVKQTARELKEDAKEAVQDLKPERLGDEGEIPS